MQPQNNPLITITTLSGERVTAPLVQWVQGLILRLSPDELISLMRHVESATAPLIVLGRDTIEADPNEWLSGHGKRT